MECIIKATGIDGSNIIAFDGKEYAEIVAKKAKELIIEIENDDGKITYDTRLSEKYLDALGSLSIQMQNCTATFDNTHKAKD